jgi:hypothetical protein
MKFYSADIEMFMSGWNTLNSTVSKRRLRFQGGSDGLFDVARFGRPSRSDLAALVQSLLQQFPFISCKVLCRKPKIGKTTCLRVLHDDLH